ncbi:MAG: hypothetical protein WD512_15805, partial [Candidatus Paceibacterota bacterium]
LVEYDPNIEWIKGQFLNPLSNQDFINLPEPSRWITMILVLKAEREKYINLESCFVWPLMHPYASNKDMCKLSIQIFLSLVPSNMIKLCVQQKRRRMTKNYCGVHMRLEDDWINHLMKYNLDKNFEELSDKIFTEITESMKRIDIDKDFFIATSLGKNKNRNNYYLEKLKDIFPNRIHIFDKVCEWKEIYPEIIEAREIEGYIDFHMCLNADILILSNLSSFSQSLEFCFNELGKPYHKYSG